MYVICNLLNGWYSNRIILSVDIFLYQTVIGESIVSSKPFKDYKF